MLAKVIIIHLVDITVIIILVSYFICLVSIIFFCLSYFPFLSFTTQNNPHFVTAVATARSSFSTKRVYSYIEY